MEKTWTDSLETIIPKVEAVAALLVVMAVHPQDIGGLKNAGSAYDLLARTLEEVCEDLNEQLIASLNDNRQGEGSDYAEDDDLL